MDLNRIKAYGISTTSKAWITNPLRLLLWRLFAPYFHGLALEIDQDRSSESTRLREEVASNLASMRNALLDEMKGALSSHIAGARKDVMAIAHRLGGLEEDVADNRQALETILKRLDQVAAEAHEAADNKQVLTLLHERLDQVATEAHEAAAYVATLHKDVTSFVAALNDRIDFLVRGNILRGGDREYEGRDELIMVTTAQKSRFLIRQHDLIGRLVADGREWEPHVRAAIERAARPDGVAVDAGAYIGLHTVTMSRCFHTVHAFEPQRGIYQVLCGNLALNDCANVVSYNAALYDRAASMRLAPSERQEVLTPMRDGQPDYARLDNAAALTFEVVENESGEVSAIKLDDLALDEVALIKVDTQGADLRVLRGAKETIRRCRPTVLFEWERDLSIQHGTSIDDYRAFFADLDYELTVLQNTSPGRQIDFIATPH